MSAEFIRKGNEYVKFAGPNFEGGMVWHRPNRFGGPLCGNTGPTAQMVAVMVSPEFPQPQCDACARFKKQ